MKNLETLADLQLIDELLSLRSNERASSLSVLLYLVEVDKRKLYRDYSFSSLFAFATGKLGYSDAGAGRRIAAARAMAEFPELIGMYERGEVTIGGISAVAGTLRLKGDKKDEILSVLPNCSTRELEQIRAAAQPRKQLREVVKPIVVEKKITTSAGRSENKHLEKRFQVQFTVSEKCMKKLDEVKSLLSNKHGSNAKVEVLFEEMIDEYIERHSPQKRAERRAKRKQKVEVRQLKRSRFVSQADKEQVFLRDGGQCTFVGADGRRCQERAQLEFDHVVPFALGGSSTAENLRLVCKCHNRLLAERTYGREFMESFG